MEEIWKDIKGYEGYYKISNLGEIKSYDKYISSKGNSKRFIKGKIMRCSRNTKGYLYIKLTIDKNKSINLLHRLIAEEFIPNPNNYPVINHINGIKDDNRLENLEWCTVEYNNKHARDTGLTVFKKGEDSHASKLNFKLANDIRILLKEGNKPYDIAKQFNISISRISEIKNNKIWVK